MPSSGAIIPEPYRGAASQLSLPEPELEPEPEPQPEPEPEPREPEEQRALTSLEAHRGLHLEKADCLPVDTFLLRVRWVDCADLWSKPGGPGGRR